MLLTHLISASKKFILLMFFSLFGGFSFGQVALNPNLNKVEESSNLSKEQQEMNEKTLKEKEKIAFPVFVKTGNSNRDNENYKKAKDAWVQANPEEYKKMISTNSVIVISKEEFLKFPAEKQIEITGHPEKYILK
jgi:hypothetical protein